MTDDDGQLLLPIMAPEQVACTSWVYVDGQRRQCSLEQHGPAEGRHAWDLHVWSGHGDREAWTDAEEGSEVRGQRRGLRYVNRM